MTKLKFGILLVAVTAFIAILIFMAAHLRARLHEADRKLLRQADRIAQLEAENEQLSNQIVHANNSVASGSEPSPELLRLRGEVGVLRRQTNELGGLRNENVRLSQAVAQSETNQVSAEDQVALRQNHAVNAMTALLQAIKSYATNHNGQYPPALNQLVASGDLKVVNLAGNFGVSDFDFDPGLRADGQGNQTILKLRVPIAKPGGGALMVVGGISDAGVPFTSVWNVGH